MIRQRKTGSVTSAGGTGGGHFRVVARPLVGVDLDFRRHTLGVRIHASRADGSSDMGGMIVRSDACGDVLAGDASCEFLVSAEDWTAVPHADLETRAIEAVRCWSQEICTGGNGGAFVESHPIDWFVTAKIIESGNLVVRAVDAERDSQLAGLVGHRLLLAFI